MDSLARNALRLSLAGAGVAVLGAGFVGQASAAELPAAPSATDASQTENLPADAAQNNTMDFGTPATDAESADAPSTDSVSTDSATTDAPSTDSVPSADSADSLPSAGSLPSADSVPSLDDLPPLEIPGAMFLEAPALS